MPKPWRSRFAVLLLALLLLAACAPPLTPQQARATAEVGGCWPSGVDQPSTPGPRPTVRPGTPTPASHPTVPAYAVCTPLPGTPTATVRPTSTPTATVRPTPLRAPPLGGLSTIGQPPGHNTNLRLAILPDGGAAVAWINWGWTPPASGPDGQVFVRVQTHGQWGLTQTLTRTPLNGDVGGVGIAALEDGTLVVAWGDGVQALWLAESRDAGATWSQPTPIGTFGYQVLSLERDAAGGLHLLALTADPHQLRYAYRTPLTTRWTTAALPFAGEHLGGALAVLSRTDGTVRRFVVARLAGTVGLAQSDDGERWTPVRVELGRFLREDNPDKVAVLAASRPAGDLIAVAWSQYSAGGVFAQLSTDGGATWGREERVAQHQADGACADSTSGSRLACGYWPSLAYDAETDSLAIAWVELVRQRESDRRTVLSARRLSELDGWRFVVAPEGGANAPPVLATWGWQGTLYGTASGAAAWLVMTDTRNGQDRVEARPIALPALLGAAAS